ncbi:MAG: helix-turn-helix domain-containing protein [Bacteroidales bacterium]|jgi:excisionase family DNA binding protein
MKSKITAHDISQLNNKIDLLTLKVDSIGQHDDENIRSIIGRIDRIEDEMKGTSNVMSSKEAAAYLGISVARLYQLIRNSQLPFFKPNRKMFFERHRLDEWVANNIK